MTGKIYFMMGSTFIMGAFAGAYLYISVFAPTYQSDIETTEAQNEGEIIVEGQMYGGCMRGDACSSFRLLSNGAYDYLEYPDAEVIQGRMQNDIVSRVFEQIGTSDFFTDTKEVAPDFCESYADGNDYSYTVTLDDEVYTLDTCTTAFAYDENLKSTLIDVWSFMSNPTKTYPPLIEEGIGGFFKDRFQNTPQE